MGLLDLADALLRYAPQAYVQQAYADTLAHINRCPTCRADLIDLVLTTLHYEAHLPITTNPVPTEEAHTMTPDTWQTLEPDLRAWLDDLAKRRAAGETVPESAAERVAAALVDGARCSGPCRRRGATAGVRGCRTARRCGSHSLSRHQPPSATLHHLLRLYSDLLQIETGELPEPLPLPPTSYFDRLRAFVMQGAEVILGALHRERLHDLPLVAEVFFSTWQGQFDRLIAQPQPQTAFNFSGETPVALRFLAATLVTTGRLGQQLSEQQVVSLQAADRLETTVQRLALRAASDLGLRREAGLFAEQYTRWVMHQIEQLPGGKTGWMTTWRRPLSRKPISRRTQTAYPRAAQLHSDPVRPDSRGRRRRRTVQPVARFAGVVAAVRPWSPAAALA
ncbi:MAG: hypothetical protein HZY76_22955 [Anaerolineae bacterium]|nr:MAG: hypothetical protein HZY76_22955 [Anaerolineae bacterium]